MASNPLLSRPDDGPTGGIEQLPVNDVVSRQNLHPRIPPRLEALEPDQCAPPASFRNR